MGGVHWLAEVDGAVVGHASVVPRILEADGLPIRTGYVEAVAVHPGLQRAGLGTRLMVEVDAHIADAYELGALGTGERPSTSAWAGSVGRARPTSGRPRATSPHTDEDDGVMVLRLPASPPLNSASDSAASGVRATPGRRPQRSVRRRGCALLP